MELEQKTFTRYLHLADRPLPSYSLTEFQRRSFETFIHRGLLETFAEVGEIHDGSGKLRLIFPDGSEKARDYGLTLWIDEPKHSAEECIRNGLTYSAPLYVKVALVNEIKGQVKVDTVFFGDVPMMTEKGTFIINGNERVAVGLLRRAPGLYVLRDGKQGGIMRAQIIPERGDWLEIELRHGGLALRHNRKRSMPFTLFLRAWSAIDDGVSKAWDGESEALLSWFSDVDDLTLMRQNVQQDIEWASEKKYPIGQAALLEMLKRLAPGEVIKLENATQFLWRRFLNERTYSLGVGRKRICRRYDLPVPETIKTLTRIDLIEACRQLLMLAANRREPDDIDHLGNKVVIGIGEMLQQRARLGLMRVERLARERMTTLGSQEKAGVSDMINTRAFQAAIIDFFLSSHYMQYAEQTNPLSELTHKRTLTLIGSEGIKREQAGFSVRDVHSSFFGRVCPIETPEGANIGLILRLALHARVDEDGIILSPYRRVKKSVERNEKMLIGRRAGEEITSRKGEVIVKRGEVIGAREAKRIVRETKQDYIAVFPYVDEVEYMPADIAERHIIGAAESRINEVGEIIDERVPAVILGKFGIASVWELEFVHIHPNHLLGVSANMIPFIEHDEGSRALMGSNMQRQAVPLIAASAPLVCTGIETLAARESGYAVYAAEEGVVMSVSGNEIVVLERTRNKRRYTLKRFERSHQNTCIDQRPVVQAGEKVARGQLLAEPHSMQGGMLALGQNVLVGFLSWDGWGYEDAIIISERLVREGLYTSVHIEEYEIDERTTRLGPEELTRDIPNVSEDMLSNLDAQGLVRIGAEVSQGDILVGKVSPKAEKDLKPEERLLYAIFGRSAKEMRDTSLRLPHGKRGTVIETRIIDRQDTPYLPVGTLRRAKVRIAQLRPLTVGDKMAGRHGNKGVVAKIVPVEDMPHLEDGTPLDVLLNPLGVPSRMNIGQIMEAHLGWAASVLGYRAVVPALAGASVEQIEAELCRAWMALQAERVIRERALEWYMHNPDVMEIAKNDDDVVIAYMESRGFNKEEIKRDIYARRRELLKVILEERNENIDEVFSDDRKALEVSLRWWLETRGVKTEGMSYEEMRARAESLYKMAGDPPPHFGMMKVYDGRTGEQFDQPVCVGYMYIMKLHHLVEDKIHARSTGPYSLITQQPLGGKSHFGGQRIGEMEVWALEAYGAAYTLQEMLTIKSDDREGRVAVYKAIVKGDIYPRTDTSVQSSSFQVLVKELQSAGLVLRGITEDGEERDLGAKHQDGVSKLPSLGGLGLLDT